MGSVSSQGGTCPRCQQDVLHEDFDTKRRDLFRACPDCGYSSSDELRDEYFDDARLGVVDPFKNYREFDEVYPAGAYEIYHEGGHGALCALGWDDPHGDAARRRIHEHNELHPPGSPERITYAILSTYNPSIGRWQRQYLNTGPHIVYRYADTRSEMEGRPLPWGDALLPAPDAPPAVEVAPEVSPGFSF